MIDSLMIPILYYNCGILVNVALEYGNPHFWILLMLFIRLARVILAVLKKTLFSIFLSYHSNCSKGNLGNVLYVRVSCSCNIYI